MQRYKIWYMRPEFFSEGIMGSEWLKANDLMPDMTHLHRTHIELKDIDADHLDDIFGFMQGEVWSPNGEARDLIASKGLAHTSMSVGDIVVSRAGETFMKDTAGWYRLGLESIR